MPYRRPLLADFVRSRQEHPKWPVVVSEGDSWFSYADAIGQLDDPKDLGDPKFQRAWCLLRLEKAGDEVMTILSGAQRAILRTIFEEFPLDALLFSGGGNDVIGADLPPLLRDFTPGAAAQDLIAFSRFERRMRQISDCYRELLDLLSDSGQKAKVFVNSYDYVVPSKKGAVYVGPFKLTGPWLQPALEARKIPKALWPDVVRLLIDGFCAAIDAVAAEPRGAGRLIRVETRGVVIDQWKDEIHPNRKGAMRVAKAFESALRAAQVIA
jgi:lysophospholipase L1-like esterase